MEQRRQTSSALHLCLLAPMLSYLPWVLHPSFHSPSPSHPSHSSHLRSTLGHLRPCPCLCLRHSAARLPSPFRETGTGIWPVRPRAINRCGGRYGGEKIQQMPSYNRTDLALRTREVSGACMSLGCEASGAFVAVQGDAGAPVELPLRRLM